ncbi:hypothetical protein P20652_3750 [Pseudoalteromonas sp. BSi20652]|uniref:hypothetical protein n=1 Tax=Pseudoalteromonas sp. BSi20652 TaxID=388384 RepID=UPI0002319193|nr:hypothetical protein [Pseudoalteromonas sp. BSi20652]GAA61861.1 hypothetical protein P20652_3750 [Pseudoalteromonas sp. BSi20652]
MDNIADPEVSQTRFSSFGTSFMGPTLSFFSHNLVQNIPENTTLFFLPERAIG